MRRPTYYINDTYKDGETEFPPWTLVQPIDDVLVPSHLKAKLEDARKFNKDEWQMCIIGMSWVPVNKKNIIERR
jgi:hypothetical protein